MRKIRCYSDALRHLRETVRGRPFKNDLQALSWVIESESRGFSSQMTPRQAWEMVARRFSAKDFERYRERLESRIISRWPRPYCSLDMNNGWRKYKHHPVQAFMEIRPLKFFCHVSDLDLAACILECGGPTSWYGNEDDKAPRIMLDDALGQVQRTHGLLCVHCRQPKEIGNWDFRVFKLHEPYGEWDERQWYEYQICDDCLVKQRTLSELRRERDEALARKFKAAMSEKRKRQEAELEAASAAYAKRKAEAKAARERAKVERQAAYELVKELGLIEQARKLMEERHETRNAAKSVAGDDEGQSPRLSA